jgi:hypothetical protein
MVQARLLPIAGPFVPRRLARIVRSDVAPQYSHTSFYSLVAALSMP